jgi:DNA polymerase-3 subunit gamma/tau
MTSSTGYLALYRKYRPQTFDDVRGRDAIVRTLKNQIITGRISHSYLFCGTRGTGKTTIAKIFAKAVNCENPHDGNPCGECAMCTAIADDASFNVIEMDAASNNSVDDIRNVIDQAAYTPTEGKKKVFIIDEVHMLSTAAFNALLKTLEEPPEYVIFILCTTEPDRLPPTILSRCQRYDFGRLSVETIEGRLREVADKEQIGVEEKALHYIAGAADGSMRDGLSLLDQCTAFNYGSGELTYDRVLEILGALDTSVFSELYRDVLKGDAAGALGILDRVLMQGREITQFVSDLSWYMRDLMLLKASEDAASDLDVSKENLQRMIEDARNSEMTQILRAIRILSRLTDEIRYSGNRRILTEAAVIRLCRPQMETDTDSILARLHDVERMNLALKKDLEELKGKLKSGVFVPAGAGMPEGGAGYGAGGGAGSAAGRDPSLRSRPKDLPKALPEEVHRVLENWDKIKSDMQDGLGKACLEQAKPSVDADGHLVIVFDSSFYQDYFTSSNNGLASRILENYLAEQTGKKVPVEYKHLDKDESFSDNYLDLSDLVDLPIETDNSLDDVKEEDFYVEEEEDTADKPSGGKSGEEEPGGEEPGGDKPGEEKSSGEEPDEDDSDEDDSDEDESDEDESDEDEPDDPDPNDEEQ